MVLSIRKPLLLLLLAFALSSAKKSETKAGFGIGAHFRIGGKYDVHDDDVELEADHDDGDEFESDHDDGYGEHEVNHEDGYGELEADHDDDEFEEEEEEVKAKPFTDEWRRYYNDTLLSHQPTWYHLGKGPDSDYEIREYPAAWWATSYTSCLNQSLATGYGYLKLYLYFQKYNYQRFEYPLTYPILTKIEEDNGEDDGKDAERCPDKFSQNLYVPIGTDEYPAATPDDSISVELIPRRRYYVKRYNRDDLEDFLTPICNAHAGVLSASLAIDNVDFDPYTWYCAQYEPGKSGLKGIFEVWFEGAVTE